MPTKRQVEKALTVKQEKFCAEYLKDGNASRAYREAYDAGNMSPATIKVKACELLKKDNVAVTVDAARKRLAKKLEITQEKLVEMLFEDREFARTLDNASAATAATMGIAKITGHTVEDRKNQRTPLQDFGTEQLQALENWLERSAGIPGEPDGQPASRTAH